MKKIIVLFILILGCVSGQIADINQRQIQEIVYFPNMNKQQIFQKSLQWFVSSFAFGKKVLEYQNLGVGKILGNLNVSFVESPGSAWWIKSKLEIDIKDNKSRLAVTGINIFSTDRGFSRSGGVGESAGWDIYEEDAPYVKDYLYTVIHDYKNYMNTSVKKDNW